MTTLSKIANQGSKSIGFRDNSCRIQVAQANLYDLTLIFYGIELPEQMKYDDIRIHISQF